MLAGETTDVDIGGQIGEMILGLMLENFRCKGNWNYCAGVVGVRTLHGCHSWRDEVAF
jgi:hypothetical protein